jgi:hypothetical protein
MAENMASPPTDSEVADNNENLTMTSTASELSRIFNSAGIIPSSKGYLSLGHDRDDEEETEEAEEAEDFVAVDHEDASDYSYLFRRPQSRPRTQLDELHPFTGVLGLSNVADCVRVEQAFPDHERCSQEKVCKTILAVFVTDTKVTDLDLV